jgi:hypothetical protein
MLALRQMWTESKDKQLWEPWHIGVVSEQPVLREIEFQYFG